MTMRPETIQDLCDHFEISVVELIANMMEAETGANRAETLVAIHADLVLHIVKSFGGDVAAGICERAANRVRSLPAYDANCLANASPAGSA